MFVNIVVQIDKSGEKCLGKSHSWCGNIYSLNDLFNQTPLINAKKSYLGCVTQEEK